MKTVASSLLSDITSTVTTLATCIEIVRKDGLLLRMTTHDTDLTVDSKVYKHDVPFNLASIQSGTQLQVDNTQLTLFADEVNVFLADFKASLWEYAEVTIFQVNYSDTTRGTITMRKGWFGPIDWSENHVVTITLTGLLKVLDLEIGRIFQASCDADLGDSRCKIAIQQNQIRSELNPYHLGDWVYYYDPALMTALTVVNPGFESDGTRSISQAITGWTKATGACFQVRNDGNGFGTIAPVAGTYFLTGATVPSSPFESGLSQDIDVSTQIGDDAAIDAGSISVAFFSALMVTEILTNGARLQMELRDTNDIILDVQDTRYVPFDTITSWREKACVMNLLPGTRKVRIWIYFRTGFAGLHGGCAADRVRMYWWDHTSGTPYSDVIQKVSRLGAAATSATYKPHNPSFETALVSNANNPTIPSWTTGSGNWWAIVASAYSGALTSQDGLHFLLGGDDGGSTQREYVISQVQELTTALAASGWQLDSSRILLNALAGSFSIRVGYGDTTSAATVIIEWRDAAHATISTLTFLNAALGTVGWHTITGSFGIIPPTATEVLITLKAKSPTGSGNAKVAFDDLRFFIYDAERPLQSDPASLTGSSSTVFATTVGDFTFDSSIIYKALPSLTAYDVVSAVNNDRNEFVGTDIAGEPGDFETAGIRFLSGNNAGLKNIIRKWDGGTGTIKTYFRTPYAIQVGDVFFYQRACQRRFIEDCVLRFENAINFRGFPYVPGAIVDGAQSFATAATITGAAAPSYTITKIASAYGWSVTVTATDPNTFQVGSTTGTFNGSQITSYAVGSATFSFIVPNSIGAGTYPIVITVAGHAPLNVGNVTFP